LSNILSSKGEKTEYNIPDNKKRFLGALPNEVFRRKDAVALGKTYQLSQRTADGFLTSSIPSLLVG